MKIACNSLRRIIALFFLLSMCLSSAYAEVPQQIQGNVDLDGAKLIVEANLFSPDVIEAPILLCKPTDWEGVDVAKVFFADRNYTVKEQQGDKGEMFPIYTSDDNEVLTLFSGKVYYETREGTILARAINTYYVDRFMNGIGEPEGELPGFPAKEAIQGVVPYIENLGLAPTANMAEAIPYAAKDLVDTEPQYTGDGSLC